MKRREGGREEEERKVQIIRFPLYAALCVTVTREGQDTSSIVAVRNQSTEVVLYAFTHPHGLYTFRLREHCLGSEDDQPVGEELTGPQEMLQVRLGSYTSNGSDIEKYALLVPGNEMTNGSTVRCTYREPGGSEFVSCDCLNRTTLTVVVFEEGKYTGVIITGR